MAMGPDSSRRIPPLEDGDREVFSHKDVNEDNFSPEG
jgi:hypothetical protein